VILIIDFGSQYNQLIARRVRENHVYCQIEPPDISIAAIKALKPEGIILSGGPASIYSKGAPRVDRGILDLGIPISGHLLRSAIHGGFSGRKSDRFDQARIWICRAPDQKAKRYFGNGVNKKTQCWMSHGDSIGSLPEGFTITASTANTPVAAAEDVQRNFYGLQFHPEVVHTQEGKKMLANFLFNICRCKKSWSMKSFVNHAVEEIRGQVGF
jgi:GMP synthase (glutamine-hydrolysing)